MAQRGSRRPAVLVALTSLAAGLLFATSATTAQGTDLRADRRLQLTELIARERAEVVRAERDAAALRERVTAATGRVAERDVRVARERERGDALAMAAGTVPVSGPALTVSLDDAPDTRDEPDAVDPATAGTELVGAPDEVVEPQPDDLVVHQQDVQAVVNALWAGGAEAMTLMGQRVISTSAVRCVGNTVVLHGRVYGPPFVVTAVGDQAQMRSALDAEPGVQVFRRYVERFGLGYEVRAEDVVQLPAYDGPLELPSVRR